MTARKWKRKTKEEIIMKKPIASPKRGWVLGGRVLGGGRGLAGGRGWGGGRGAWVPRVTPQLLCAHGTQLIGGLFCR